MFVFYYKRIITGGAELLIEKLGRELINTGEMVAVWCLEAEPDMVMRYENSNIEVKTNINIFDISMQRREIDRNINFICFQIVDYCFINMCVKKEDRVIIYIMHYASLCMGMLGKHKILKTFWKKTIPTFLDKLNQRERLFVMDETTIDYTKNYFRNSKLNKSCFNIIRIPADKVEIKGNHETRLKEKKILSIARADFPFKGYLLGLLDYAERMPKDFYIDIVSYGSDQGILEERYNSLPKEVQKRVHLYGKMSFEQLDNLFNKAKVYIGMGTTLLDATQRNVISIPVKADTYELFGNSFFIDDYRKLVVDSKETKNNIDSLIETIIKMSREEYIQKANEGRKLVLKNYATNNIVILLKQKMSNSKKNLKYFIEKIIYIETVIKFKKGIQ